MNDGVVELAELLELGDESPDGAVRVVDGAVVDGGLIVERAIPGSLNQRLMKKGASASRFSSSQAMASSTTIWQE